MRRHPPARVISQHERCAILASARSTAYAGFMNLERRHPLDLTPEEESAADARALADIAAGRTFGNDEVVAWLKTWGQPDRKPFPRQWPK